jgi:hypothetical protein
VLTLLTSAVYAQFAISSLSQLSSVQSAFYQSGEIVMTQAYLNAFLSGNASAASLDYASQTSGIEISGSNSVLIERTPDGIYIAQR